MIDYWKFVHQKRYYKMKSNKAKDKEFDTVGTCRKIKEKISLEMAGMNFEQIKAYLAESSKKFTEQMQQQSPQ